MAPPELTDGVDVWVASLDAALGRAEAFASDLSEPERKRAGRFRAVADARRFVVGRGLLRLLLGAYLDEHPARVGLVEDRQGKPRLAGARAAPPIRFNLSHAGGVALYAFARDREVGVDLERIDPAVAWPEVVAAFFSRAESRRLDALPAGDRPAAFFREWTRREAWLKARGEGLGGWERERAAGPDWGALPLVPGRWTIGDRAGMWTLLDLDVAAGYAAALAVDASGSVAPAIRVRTSAGPI